MLFVLGGNGTHAGANAIHEEVVKTMAFILKWALCYMLCSHLIFNIHSIIILSHGIQVLKISLE